MTPIPITRAEYEKKFGVKPVATSTSILEDEKPAPIRVTRAEWEAMQKQWNPAPDTYMQDAMKDVAETKQAVLNTAERGAQRSGEISQRVATGETSKAKGLFQKFGTALTSTGNMVLDVGIGAAKAILPQKAEDSVSSFFKGLGEVVTDKNADFYKKEVLPDLQSSDPDKQASAKFIVETLDAYKNDPNFKADVDAAGGIVGALFAQPTKAAVSKTIDVTTDVAKDTVKATGELASGVSKKLDTRSVTKVADELGKIEDKYAKSRNANSYSNPKDIAASRARIAESNVLDGTVDSNGVIRTEGAVNAYRKQTIDGMEDMVRQGLIESKETIPTAMVRQALVREVGKSGLEGADLVTALRKIDKEIEGLNTRIKGSSIVDLRYLHDNKIATTRNINYQTPPEKATYRKAVARAYKILVEENSKKVDVKGINNELSKFYDDIERLERLDGARAEGGRLGKYTAAMAGTIIGGAAGSVGGGFGAAIGGIIGGEAAAALKGAGMARTFKGGGKGLPKSAVLEKAKLSIPDKPVKAKAGIAKTKEITELESKIAKNVADQKKAIAKGDFALVAALKEIYTTLVDELEELVKSVVESAKNPSIGLSTKRVTDDATLTDVGRANKLAEEAKKYKSAEEFVKAQGNKTYYHTTSTDIAPLIEKQGFKAQIGERTMGTTQGNGVFFYEDVSPTVNFGKNLTWKGKEPTVVESKIDGKIYSSKSQSKSINALAEDTALIEKLKADGFVGIRGTENGTPVTFVFEPSAVKTKAQLIDIWKKANETKP